MARPAALLALLCAAAVAPGGGFAVDGNSLIVVRLGDGVTNLPANVWAPVALEEWRLSGSTWGLASTTSVPSTGQWILGRYHYGCVLWGNSASGDSQATTGLLSVSVNRRYMTFVCNDPASPSTARILVRVDAFSVVDTSTRIANVPSTTYLYAAVSLDGSRFWTSGFPTMYTAAYGANDTNPLAWRTQASMDYRDLVMYSSGAGTYGIAGTRRDFANVQVRGVARPRARAAAWLASRSPVPAPGYPAQSPHASPPHAPLTM